MVNGYINYLNLNSKVTSEDINPSASAKKVIGHLRRDLFGVRAHAFFRAARIAFTSSSGTAALISSSSQTQTFPSLMHC